MKQSLLTLLVFSFLAPLSFAETSKVSETEINKTAADHRCWEFKLKVNAQACYDILLSDTKNNSFLAKQYRKVRAQDGVDIVNVQKEKHEEKAKGDTWIFTGTKPEEKKSDDIVDIHDIPTEQEIADDAAINDDSRNVDIDLDAQGGDAGIDDGGLADQAGQGGAGSVVK